MVPCAEMVAFGKNGSDVVDGRGPGRARGHGPGGDPAVRLPRLPRLVHVPVRERRGDARRCCDRWSSRSPTTICDALEHCSTRFTGQVAAVVMEPVNMQHAAAGLPRGGARARARARRPAGVRRDGDRVPGRERRRAGAVRRRRPTSRASGKAMANGMPLSALVGSASTCATCRTSHRG